MKHRLTPHLAAAGSSMHESRAHHAVGEEVGVSVPADLVADDRLPQTVESVKKGKLTLTLLIYLNFYLEKPLLATRND
ncbi:hypothetical protein AMECASPLE_003057 [Ameca splendens]|uniref:Uncharacterized protein n=1 Tax=Ameca splendens TaxID=208324 RepID=A0ABV0YWZ4_9TELE